MHKANQSNKAGVLCRWPQCGWRLQVQRSRQDAEVPGRAESAFTSSVGLDST